MEFAQITQFVKRLKAAPIATVGNVHLSMVSRTLKTHPGFTNALSAAVADFDEPLNLSAPSLYHSKLMEGLATTYRALTTEESLRARNAIPSQQKQDAIHERLRNVDQALRVRNDIHDEVSEAGLRDDITTGLSGLQSGFKRGELVSFAGSPSLSDPFKRMWMRILEKPGPFHISLETPERFCADCDRTQEQGVCDGCEHGRSNSYSTHPENK